MARLCLPRHGCCNFFLYVFLPPLPPFAIGSSFIQTCRLHPDNSWGLCPWYKVRLHYVDRRWRNAGSDTWHIVSSQQALHCWNSLCGNTSLSNYCHCWPNTYFPYCLAESKPVHQIQLWNWLRWRGYIYCMMVCHLSTGHTGRKAGELI